MSTPFFMTHHAPVGAWASFTFGLPSRGVSIDHESNEVRQSAEFLVALSKDNVVRAMPFFSDCSEIDRETLQREAAMGRAASNIASRWKFIDANAVSRTLTPAIDEFKTDGMTLRVYTPHPAIPDGGSRDALCFALLPAVIIELTVDNTQSDTPAYGFLGLAIKTGRLRTVDVSTDKAVCGVGFGPHWAFVARPEANGVYTIRDGSIADAVEKGAPRLLHKGREGGVALAVPPRSEKTLTMAFGFYREGNVTVGIESRYAYTEYFKNVDEVCDYALRHVDEIKRSCAEFDAETKEACPEPLRRELFAQALRAYYANAQLTMSNEGRLYYNILEGCFYWRNTMDLAADHLGWELWRNPWVVRNIMDLYIERYSYYDSVRFEEQDACGNSVTTLHPGGLSFAHDMGSSTMFTPEGRGGYEQADVTGCYSFMTTEELLNGVYLLTGYVIASGDAAWGVKNRSVFEDVLISMENRDHYDASKRDGIIKGESDMVGTGAEITSYDVLDHSLLRSRGNLYIAVKTWCSAILLARAFTMLGNKPFAERARLMAEKTAATLTKAFSREFGCLPANLYEGGQSKVIAVLEPLAVAYFLSMEREMNSYVEFIACLKNHAETCLKEGDCIDSTSGGLRLSSASTNSWPSKGILCLYVIEKLMNVRLEERYPTLVREIAVWMQIAARESTVADQINVSERAVSWATYYPRLITSSLWIRPRMS